MTFGVRSSSVPCVGCSSCETRHESVCGEEVLQKNLRSGAVVLNIIRLLSSLINEFLFLFTPLLSDDALDAV